MNCDDCRDRLAKQLEIRRLHNVCREYREELEQQEELLNCYWERINTLEGQKAELERQLQDLEARIESLQQQVQAAINSAQHLLF